MKNEVLQRAQNAYLSNNFVLCKTLCIDGLRGEPNCKETLQLLGATHIQLGDLSEAIRALQTAAKAHSSDAHVFNNLGFAYLLANDFDAAQRALAHSIKCDSTFAGSRNNMGLALKGLKQLGPAIEAFSDAITLAPDHADAYNNRGSALFEIGRVKEAMIDYATALRLRPLFYEAHLNQGRALLAVNQVEASNASFDMALKAKPNDPTALWAKGQNLLLEGEYREGWKFYEYRWNSPKFTDKPRAFPAPLWLGQLSLSGRSILVHAEQGYGDTLQFCRYIPLLAQQAELVTLIAQPELTQLLNDSKLNAKVITPADRPSPFDVHCPLMSLPHAFGTTLQTVPSGVPYLHADDMKAAQWQKRLGPATRLRVGIAWAGRPTHINDARRSVGLASLEPLLSADVEFHALGIEGVPQHLSVAIHDHAANLKDFADTAALVSCLDLVITVDTSAAHLAGALGKPVWTMLAYAPDFRWMLDRPDTPWYPTMRLFRQRQLGDWTGVIADVKQALQSFRRQ